MAIATTALVTQSTFITSLVLYHRPAASFLTIFLTAAACILAWQHLR